MAQDTIVQNASAKVMRLVDYTPPDFLVDTVDLDVDVQTDHARVTSRLQVRRNPKSAKADAPLFLNGKGQKLLSVSLNGQKLDASAYALTDEGLAIPAMPDEAVLEIVSTHNPYDNKSMAGFYKSGPMLLTQCEAESFRNITYYPDRPDVMAKFRTTLHADRAQFPKLLSNGNLVHEADEGNGRHVAVWEDPHLKPCYLFAMAAGELDKIEDHFITMSGRRVRLEIFTEPDKTGEAKLAMKALKASMKWDEEKFGREYDLDVFMIVATPFFNMGAMENKGLNIFNENYVLGRPETAHDSDLEGIEGVIAHEYFHNWTGNRITCRDWFQLTLKEGLTVYRDQEFSSDMNSRPVMRIQDVRGLRSAQFAEDASPMSHPIRPDHYEAIDNFYTATVYSKGAEVIRMMEVLVGKDGFRKGMDLYFMRHDGQAATCEDFVASIADANNIDLTQFMRWYSQPGTPTIKAEGAYDAAAQTYTLKLSQFVGGMPLVDKPLHIPVAVGLLDAQGNDLIGTHVLSLTEGEQSFTFRNITAPPVPSLLRNFSAPVRLDYAATDDEQLFLLAHDSDPFNRWEAANKLLTKYVLAAVEGKPVSDAPFTKLTQALGNVLKDQRLDDAFKAYALALPTEGELGIELAAQKKPIDPEAVYKARKEFHKKIAAALQGEFTRTYAELSARKIEGDGSDAASRGLRSLKNLCLGYMAADENANALQKAYDQVATSNNMTDQLAGLSVLASTTSPLRAKAFATFESRWQHDTKVMNEWFRVQALSKQTDVLTDVQRLRQHPLFDITNPNLARSLYGAFAANIVGFHAADGSGYRLIADAVLELDALKNAQMASRFATFFKSWRDYEPKRRDLMKAELQRIAARPDLSKNVAEIVSRSLA